MIPQDKLLSVAHTLIPSMYEYQREVMKSIHENTETIINKSRQIGISYAIACWSLIRAVLEERVELIISPSLRQSKHMMDYVYEHMRKLERDFTIPLKEETKTSIMFETGGEIHSLPNSANTVRGYRADDIYIDEFAHFTNGTDKEVLEAILPSISRGGHILYISTPFGDQNLFYEYWHDREDIRKITINWRECPDMSEEKILAIKQAIGEDAFNQEYENQFLSDVEGQEFPFQLISSCIDHELQYTDLSSRSKYLGGADIGREHDLTAFIAFEKQGGKYIAKNKRTMSNTPYHEQLNFFTYLLKNFTFEKFHIDETGIGNMLAEELSRIARITRITFNNENKQEMVANLKRLMQEGKVRYPNDAQLIDSIRSIRRKYSDTNYLKFESVRTEETGHADLFWAMALALYGESMKKPFVMPVHL